ncbi:unnamed protein product [Periconia digitata]|uniref:Uncharacterized protein n=1 Tax=Periconia digitata TaxID=1303443 RepID=A0A9W4UG54_9PLEO|nr:unnamed protein product [Periconia digitata]
MTRRAVSVEYCIHRLAGRVCLERSRQRTLYGLLTSHLFTHGHLCIWRQDQMRCDSFDQRWSEGMDSFLQILFLPCHSPPPCVRECVPAKTRAMEPGRAYMYRFLFVFAECPRSLPNLAGDGVCAIMGQFTPIYSVPRTHAKATTRTTNSMTAHKRCIPSY